MTSRTVRAALAALVAALVTPHAAAAEKPDYRKAAARIVESAAVKEGDLVFVSGDVATIDLVEEIGVAVAARGGHPIQQLYRGRTGVRYYAEVPEKYDSTRAAFWNEITELVDVVIRVDWP